MAKSTYPLFAWADTAAAFPSMHCSHSSISLSVPLNPSRNGHISAMLGKPPQRPPRLQEKGLCVKSYAQCFSVLWSQECFVLFLTVSYQQNVNFLVNLFILGSKLRNPILLSNVATNGASSNCLWTKSPWILHFAKMSSRVPCEVTLSLYGFLELFNHINNDDINFLCLTASL